MQLYTELLSCITDGTKTCRASGKGAALTFYSDDGDAGHPGYCKQFCASRHGNDWDSFESDWKSANEAEPPNEAEPANGAEPANDSEPVNEDELANEAEPPNEAEPANEAEPQNEAEPVNEAID